MNPVRDVKLNVYMFVMELTESNNVKVVGGNNGNAYGVSYL